jgi:hypothetical protein
MHVLQDIISTADSTNEAGHIMLLDHLDLSTMAAADVGTYAKLELQGYEGVKSIRVRCPKTEYV